MQHAPGPQHSASGLGDEALTRYSPEIRAGVISHPATDAEAAEAFGIPRRTVSAIRAKYRTNPRCYGPIVRRLVDDATGDTLPLVRELRETSCREMLRRVKDPKTRAGELAAIFRETRDEVALREGRPTANTANLNLNLEANDTPDLTRDEWRAFRDLTQALGVHAPMEMVAAGWSAPTDLDDDDGVSDVG